MPVDDVVISLTHDQALVLSEWLYRVIGTPAFDSIVDEDRAVWSPLHRISGQLAKTLPEIFNPTYANVLHDARERLLDGLGDLGRPPVEDG